MSRWVFYETPAGGTPVKDAIHSLFPGSAGKSGRVVLGGLLTRIAEGETLRRDVVDLGDGLAEARMTLNGNEYRLFFARRRCGLVGLHFVQKKANKIPQHIKTARGRLARYDGGAP
jgi:hypothetical protein